MVASQHSVVTAGSRPALSLPTSSVPPEACAACGSPLGGSTLEDAVAAVGDALIGLLLRLMMSAPTARLAVEEFAPSPPRWLRRLDGDHLELEGELHQPSGQHPAGLAKRRRSPACRERRGRHPGIIVLRTCDVERFDIALGLHEAAVGSSKTGECPRVLRRSPIDNHRPPWKRPPPQRLFDDSSNAIHRHLIAMSSIARPAALIDPVRRRSALYRHKNLIDPPPLFYGLRRGTLPSPPSLERAVQSPDFREPGLTAPPQHAPAPRSFGRGRHPLTGGSIMDGQAAARRVPRRSGRRPP